MASIFRSCHRGTATKLISLTPRYRSQVFYQITDSINNLNSSPSHIASRSISYKCLCSVNFNTRDVSVKKTDSPYSRFLSSSSDHKNGKTETTSKENETEKKSASRRTENVSTLESAKIEPLTDDLDNSVVSNLDDDPFGVKFDDGPEYLGPTLPPKYMRDSVSGRFTGLIERELSESERRLLESDPINAEKELTERVLKGFKSDGDGTVGEKLNQLGQRIRESDMSLNVLGRSPQAQSSYEVLDDGTKMGRDDKHFTQFLTPSEFNTLETYMKKLTSVPAHETVLTDDDIPVLETNQKKSRKNDIDPDDVELSLKWLTARAQRQMDYNFNDENIYSELMPFDLNPGRRVSRKKAKLIPSRLLHHNNIPLLLGFMTPTLQIQNRIRTRLGAKDQRRVSRLIRRARAMGLLPYSGQVQVEKHGWVHAPDIKKDRKWERELARRGLTIQRNKKEGSDNQ